MLFMVRPDTKSVHSLADLLETMEVTADELMDLKFDAHDLAAIRAMSDGDVQARLAALREFVGRLRSLELAIVAKLTQARQMARAVARSDWRLRPIMMLFTSGTQAFTDLFEAESNAIDRAFDGSSQVFPYLRSRGLISPLTEHYDGSAELLVTDSFRLLGVMQLRDLLERCEATLNALDAHYDLFDLEDYAAEDEAVASVTIREQLDPPALETPATETIQATADQAINWGTDVAQAAVTPETPAVANEAQPSSTSTQQPAEAEIVAAHEASEASLKGLTERLAELKAEPTAVAVADEEATAA